MHHGVPDPFGELPQGRERMALTVGIVDRRNVLRKGLGTFVRAAALLPDVEFVLAGRWDDGAADELREGQHANVTLTGWVEEGVLNEAPRRASVYVQASVHEGFGRSVAEGMLAGCIGHGAGALPESSARSAPRWRTGSRAARGRDRTGPRGQRRRAGGGAGARAAELSTGDQARGRAGARDRDARPVLLKARGDDGQPVQRHADAPDRGDAAPCAQAEVGDEQRFDDPTVNALQERVAELLGKEAAAAAVGHDVQRDRVQAARRPGGDEGDPRSHVPSGAVRGRGPAALSERRSTFDGDGGIFTAAGGGRGATGGRPLRAALRLVSVEQMTNIGGGRCGLESTAVVVASRHGLRLHLDGARLMNMVASGVPAADHARGFDTAWLDFTKGLGAPVGAVLAASRELIDEAWRYKQMLGGAMRQAGVLAAAALHALDHHVERLAADHANARRLAPGWRDRRRADRTGPGRDQHRHLRGRRRADLRPDVGARDPARAAGPAAITGGDTSRRRDASSARWRSFVRFWRGPAAEAPATQAARPPAARDRQTRSPALAPGWCSRAPRRAPRRRRQHPDREPVRPPHVAVGLAPAPTTATG